MASTKALLKGILGGAGIGLVSLAVASEARLQRPLQPLTGAWEAVPVLPHGDTLLGISFRPLQAAALGLDPEKTLRRLLSLRYPMIRIGAYWNRMEPEPGAFLPAELDWQIDAAEEEGKHIILCIGPLKTFGYPEFFVPSHHLPCPLPEGQLVLPSSHPALLSAAIDFAERLVERYKDRRSIVAWQVEHEAADPLGAEHSWRLSRRFVEEEQKAVREADPSRPILMNGFLPTSVPVRLSQWWRTRDQGDSLAVARQLADIVGIDYYPRHALASLGARTLYLDGSASPWNRGPRLNLLNRARQQGRQLMVSEGQAEPWEAVTVPPNPSEGGMYSCLPEHLIHNYNSWMYWTSQGPALYSYLFWGAEYWVLREQGGDDRYMGAFARILDDGQSS